MEVSRLSFLPEYGPKLKEDYVTVKHLPKIQKEDDDRVQGRPLRSSGQFRA